MQKDNFIIDRNFKPWKYQSQLDRLQAEADAAGQIHQKTQASKPRHFFLFPAPSLMRKIVY
jgi:hypothetical protein